ncbi:hypothetical protein MMPV_001295 [Pyropia vietnamensis]
MAAVAAGAPTRWSATDKCESMAISADGLVATYDGIGMADKDASAVRADAPVPMAGIAFYYFEMFIKSAGESGFIGIGLSARDVLLTRLPGWEARSWAYHADDGHAFAGSGSGDSYGPTYTTGDTIGCLWNLTDATVTFTKNGKSLGVAFRNVTGELYPTVGMRTVGEVAEANFGASDPAWLTRTAASAAASSGASELESLSFDRATPGSRRYLFDIEGYVARRRSEALAAAAATELPRPLESVSGVVLQYLVHAGAPRAAAAFAAATDRRALLDSEMAARAEREAAYTAVCEGRIDDAVAAVAARHPTLLPSSPRLAVRLLCAKFVELVRGGRLEDALAFAQTRLAPYRDGGAPPGGASFDLGGKPGTPTAGAAAAAVAASTTASTATAASPNTAAFVPLSRTSSGASDGGSDSGTNIGLADVLLATGGLSSAGVPPPLSVQPATSAAGAVEAGAGGARAARPPAARGSGGGGGGGGGSGTGRRSTAVAVYVPSPVRLEVAMPVPFYSVPFGDSPMGIVLGGSATGAAVAQGHAREASAKAAAAAATATAAAAAAAAASARADAVASAAGASADLQAALSLLAYDDPAGSPTAAVLSDAHRAAVAAELRDALLAAQARSSASALERLVAHAAVMLKVQASSAVGTLSLVAADDFLPPAPAGATDL